MIIEAEIKEWGNSYGIRIPKGLAKKAKLEKGDWLTLLIKKKEFGVGDGFGICRGAKPFKRDPADDFHER